MQQPIQLCRPFIHPGQVSSFRSTCAVVGRSDERFLRLTTELKALLSRCDTGLSRREILSRGICTGSTCSFAAGKRMVYRGRRAPKVKTATTTQNEYSTPRWEAKGLMMPGITAPPEIAAVRNTDPVLVNAPRPRRDMAKMMEKMPDCGTIWSDGLDN